MFVAEIVCIITKYYLDDSSQRRYTQEVYTVTLRKQDPLMFLICISFVAISVSLQHVSLFSPPVIQPFCSKVYC
jgi:hypothetical protein